MLTLLATGQPQNGSYVNELIKQFKARVAADAGTFEAEECLTNHLNNL
ncbi:hypothetical protein [Flavobacterium sp. N2820]|nr:hypothetical protein [Flavobacterium sp. N2820]